MTAVDVEHPPTETDSGEVSRLRLLLADPGRLFNLIGIPIVVTVALVVLWLWVSPMELSFRQAQRLNAPELRFRGRQHVQLTMVATFFIVVIAVPLGVMLTRPWARRVSPVFLAIANAGQAIPSIGLMTLLAIVMGVGARTGVVAVVAYCILPVLRNTMVGIRQVDPAIIESARGMGMTKLAVLRKIELPLAVPVMLAGIRTALILAVGTITLAALIAAGTLGVIINAGIRGFNTPVLVTGAVLTASLALLIDWLAGIAEIVLRPKGL